MQDQRTEKLIGTISSRILIQELDIESRKTRLHIYLGVLLHQMLTTFLLTYSCGGGVECPEKFDGVKDVEYSTAWQDLAYSLEKTAKYLLCLDLNLLRKCTLVIELCRNKGVVSGVMGRWGFEDENMRDLVLEKQDVVRSDILAEGSIMKWMIVQEFGARGEKVVRNRA